MQACIFPSGSNLSGDFVSQSVTVVTGRCVSCKPQYMPECPSLDGRITQFRISSCLPQNKLLRYSLHISTNRGTSPGIVNSVTNRGQRSASHSGTCSAAVCVVPRVSPNCMENTRLAPQALNTKTDRNEVTTGPAYTD